MVITDETIDYVGILAKLELSDPAMSHAFPISNVFREDVVTNGDDRENMLANAPEERNGCYDVPKTFD